METAPTISDDEIHRFLRRCHLGLSEELETMLNKVRTVWLGIDEAIHLREVEAFAAI